MAEVKYAGVDVGKKSLVASVTKGGDKAVFKQFINDAKGQQMPKGSKGWWSG